MAKEADTKRSSGYGNSGASHTKRAFRDWFTEALSPDEDITRNLPTLRARSRDLYMSTPLAAGAIKTITAGVVGSGLMIHPHIDRETLGLTDEQASEWEKKVEREWLAYSESTACDAQRSMNFYQMQRLAFMSSLMSGDCFIALPYIARPNSYYRLKGYLIEGDRVCNPTAQYLSEVLDPHKDIREGIEIGDFGEPVAYYVSKYHPGDHSGRRIYLNGDEFQKIMAFGQSGRQNILHIMDHERPGQRRGVPLLSTVLENLKQIERYTSSELMAAVISSYFTVFLKKVNPAEGFDGGIPSPTATEEQEIDPNSIRLGQGAMVTLPQDTDIEIANPGRPNSLYSAFIETQCRMMGSGIDLPYEMLVKHFIASYSASRAAQLEANKAFRIRREMFIGQFIKPFFREWLLEAIILGRINAPGALEDPMILDAYTHITVTGDSVGCLDPTKEVQAAILRIDNNLSTIQQEAGELNGMSAEEIAQQREKELNLFGFMTSKETSENSDKKIEDSGPSNNSNDKEEPDKGETEDADTDPKE